MPPPPSHRDSMKENQGTLLVCKHLHPACCLHPWAASYGEKSQEPLNPPVTAFQLATIPMDPRERGWMLSAPLLAWAEATCTHSACCVPGRWPLPLRESMRCLHMSM